MNISRERGKNRSEVVVWVPNLLFENRTPLSPISTSLFQATEHNHHLKEEFRIDFS